ncbi:hypothetical protein PINS_up003648 [Pythium insidiosum]|nr:hypothetical protein PINS_up003648 [Pythium insidiosum]
MDDDGDSVDKPPSSAAMATPLMRGLLEDSLQQLFPPGTDVAAVGSSPSMAVPRTASDAIAAAPLQFEDDEMHALLPMLSDTSFEYDCQDDTVIAAHNVVDESAFPQDLSPILSAIPPPTELGMPAESIMSLVMRKTKKAKTTPSSDQRPAISLDSKPPMKSPRKALSTPTPRAPRASSSSSSSPAVSLVAGASHKRRRRLRSTGLSTIPSVGRSRAERILRSLQGEMVRELGRHE